VYILNKAKFGKVEDLWLIFQNILQRRYLMNAILTN
jgi:hypothetical protein